MLSRIAKSINNIFNLILGLVTLILFGLISLADRITDKLKGGRKNG